MVSHVPGSHRRPAAAPPDTDGLLPPPLGAAGIAAGAAGTSRPGPGGMARTEVLDGAVSPGPGAFLAGADPDWPPDPGRVPWAQWDAPPPILHPDHPSAPVPRVRVPRPPGPRASSAARASPPGQSGPAARGHSPAGDYDSGRYLAAQGYDAGPRGPGRDPAARADGTPRGNLPGRGYEPSPGYGAGQGYEPAPGYGPARAYDAGQGLAPAQGRDPGSGYVAGRDYGPGPGHGVVRDYHPGSGYPRPQGRPGNRGDQRLFAVPDGARADGPQYRAGAGQVAPFPGRHPLGPAGPARGQAGSADSGELWLARRALAAAEDEAAAIRRAAEQEATATRQAAEQEAAELRAAVMTMSAELGRVAAYVSEYLGRHAVREERPRARPAAVPRQGLAPQDTPARPAGPATGPGRPNARTAPRPGAPPIPRPSDRPGARQAAAMRKMVVVFAALFAVAVAGGLAQLGLHGFRFFAFRAAGTGATDNNGLQENQGPGQPDAPRTHHAKPAAHHSAPKPKAQRSSPA